MAKNVISLVIDGDAQSALAALARTDAGLKAWFANLTATSKKTGVLIGGALAAGTVAIGESLFDLGRQFDAAFDRIRVGTGATGKQLDGLKSAFKDVFSSVPADTETVATAIADLNTRLGLTGKALEDRARQFINLSRITKTDLGENISSVTGLFNNWSVATKDQSQVLDTLFRVSQKTGVSVSSLATDVANAGPQLRTLGFSLAQSAAMIGLLGKSGVESGPVIQALSRAIASAAKAGEQAPDTFKRLVDQIKAAKDPTEAAGLAIEVFGARAGPKLAGLIAEGKLSFEDFSKTIAKGDSINKAAKDTDDFAEKWQQFTNMLKTKLEPIASQVFGGLTRLLDFIQTPAGKAVAALVGVGAAIVGLVAVFAKVRAAFTALSALLTANPYAVLIAATVALAVIVVDNWDEISAFLTDTWNSILGVAEDVWDAIAGVISDAWDVIVFIFKNLTIYGLIVSHFDQIINFFKSLPGILLDALGDLGEMLANAIIGGFKAAWNATVGIINDAIPNEIGLPFGLSIDLPNNPIPRLAFGGIVTKPTLALIGEGGPEAVVPLNGRGGGMGMTVNIEKIVSSSPEETPVQLARRMRQQMFLMGV